MGDFQGHPFRGNQWTDTKGGSSQGGTTVERGDWFEKERKGVVRGLAEELLNRAVEMEPSVTTALRIATQGSGGYLEGLKHRLKEMDSLERKLNERGALTPETASEAIHDALRYTVVGFDSNYTKQYDAVLETLAEKGYTVVDAKNYWSNEPSIYQGTNLVMQGPNGDKFELQFHTPESYAAKQEAHAHYKIYRTTQVREVRLREFAAMLKIQSKVRRPVGWPPRDNRLRTVKDPKPE